MSALSRRDFLHRSVLGASAIAATASFTGEAKAQSTSKTSATDRVELGKTGIKASRVAMGTGYIGGRRSSSQTRLGYKGFNHLMRHGIDQGVNFIDMADLYGSHPYMKYTLEEVPREDLILLSKIWFTQGDGFAAIDTAKPTVERFRQELGVDMIDIVLLHCLTDGNWTEHRKKMMDDMAELKEKEVIRAVGCSCHNFDALKVAASEPWVDVIFARINHVGRDASMDGSPDQVSEVLKTARANGKAVVGMKIYGAGKLTDAEQRDASLRYVWGNNLIDAMTIGFEKPEQVDDTMNHLNRVLKG